MALSPLGAQLEEVAGLLPKVARGISEVNRATQAVLSTPVVQSGGGGGQQAPVLFGPSGAPIGPGSIEEFLRRRDAAASSPKAGSKQGGSGGSSGGGIAEYVAPASGNEQVLMAALGEGLEYVRKLIKAAVWAGLPEQVVIRAPKDQRDALIAAYEQAMSELSPGSKITRGADIHGGKPLYYIRQSGGGVDTGAISARELERYGGAHGDPTSSQFSSASAKTPPPTAGDKLVAEAVNKVAESVDKMSKKLDSNGGLGFRMKGI